MKNTISEYMAMIGRKGGKKTAKKHGKAHFKRISKIAHKKKLSTILNDYVRQAA